MSFWEYLHLHKGTLVVLSIIGIIGLLSITWFGGDYLISSVDFSMPLDRLRSFVANFYVWDSRSLGFANPRVTAFTFPVFSFFALSDVIGISVVGAEKILFYCIFTVSGLSTVSYTHLTLPTNRE